MASLITPTILLGSKEGEKVDLASADVIGLYFSAHWCPPCKAFTPKLATVYNKLRKQGKKIEIVFVSGDVAKTNFDEYFETMPWLALPFQHSLIKELQKKFKIQGIPSLILLKPDGEVITRRGREAIEQSPDGFPWTDFVPTQTQSNYFGMAVSVVLFAIMVYFSRNNVVAQGIIISFIVYSFLFGNRS
eukprot:m.23478 g.23478  ORF g.23478 m.23478 type:complete len:189 (+) comp7503_c0_seq3:71-637(+)